MKLKKILISIILVIVVFGVILYVSLDRKNNLKTADNFENQILDNLENQENMFQENEIIDNKIITTAEQPLEEATTQISSTYKAISEEKPSDKQSIQSTSSQQTQVKTETKIPTTKEPIEAPNIPEEKTENTTPQNPSTITKNEEKYIRNDTMISKIKNIINNNPSEYMKTYGYEVVVDSSIKKETSQFTFTENRIKAFITNKFGTIRIYAEDYYKNGELIMTQCYIL